MHRCGRSVLVPGLRGGCHGVQPSPSPSPVFLLVWGSVREAPQVGAAARRQTYLLTVNVRPVHEPDLREECHLAVQTDTAISRCYVATPPLSFLFFLVTTFIQQICIAFLLVPDTLSNEGCLCLSDSWVQTAETNSD